MPPPSGGRAEWRVTSVLPQAKPWRRRNSIPPSISITEGRSAAMRRGTQKERHDFRRAFLFGGDEEDRTLDLTDAKRHLNLFCIIFNYLWCFPLGFSFFPPLFGTLISMCYAAVCGASCGQKHSPPFAGNGCPAWTGSIFMPLIACIVTLRSKLSKSFLYRLYLRNWRAVNNKEAFCSRRLRKLKRIFMRFPHSL